MSAIFLRNAEMSDMRLLHVWRNEESVRMNSFTTDPVPFENHCSWFQRVMSDDSVRIYILMDDETPIGQIRINEQGSLGEISYSVDQSFRGRGYGTKIISLCMEKEKELGRIRSLTGKVKYSNPASQKAFEKNGFGKDTSEQDYISYYRDIT